MHLGRQCFGNAAGLVFRESKAIGQVYREYFRRHYPAMTLVQVAALLEDGAKVEIEATAIL